MGGDIGLIFKVCPVDIPASWKPKNSCLVVVISQVSAFPWVNSYNGFQSIKYENGFLGSIRQTSFTNPDVTSFEIF